MLRNINCLHYVLSPEVYYQVYSELRNGTYTTAGFLCGQNLMAENIFHRDVVLLNITNGYGRIEYHFNKIHGLFYHDYSWIR